MERLSWEDILEEEEMEQFEIDMEKKVYVKWIEKYPELIQDILQVMHSYAGYPGDEIVKDLIKRGLDVNMKGGYNSECTTYLEYASESQDSEFIDILLSNDAKPSKYLIEDIILGNEGLHIYNFEDILNSINVIKKYKQVSNSMRKVQYDIIMRDYEEDEEESELKQEIMDFMNTLTLTNEKERDEEDIE